MNFIANIPLGLAILLGFFAIYFGLTFLARKVTHRGARAGIFIPAFLVLSYVHFFLMSWLDASLHGGSSWYDEELVLFLVVGLTLAIMAVFYTKPWDKLR